MKNLAQTEGGEVKGRWGVRGTLDGRGTTRSGGTREDREGRKVIRREGEMLQANMCPNIELPNELQLPFPSSS